MPDRIEDQNLRESAPKAIQQLIGGTLAELAEAASAFLEDLTCLKISMGQIFEKYALAASSSS